MAIEHLIAAVKANPETELATWSQLLARWQVNSSNVSVREAARCQTQVFAGLDCLHGKGTIDQLARFDRPLILVLQKDQAQAHALLLGVGESLVWLSFAGERHAIDKTRLGEIWPGEFFAVWRIAENVPARLHNGDAGEGVAWVKAQLARMDAKPVEPGPAFFDAVVEERVRKLQTAYGITPDGIVGPETLFALSALDPNGPHLARNLE